jgi:hypothetical protein
VILVLAASARIAALRMEQMLEALLEALVEALVDLPVAEAAADSAVVAEEEEEEEVLATNFKRRALASLETPADSIMAGLRLEDLLEVVAAIVVVARLPTLVEAESLLVAHAMTSVTTEAASSAMGAASAMMLPGLQVPGVTEDTPDPLEVDSALVALVEVASRLAEEVHAMNFKRKEAANSVTLVAFNTAPLLPVKHLRLIPSNS